MKDIKICYTNALNLGDAINPIIIERVFDSNPVHSNEWNCDITGIGSGLRRFFVLKESKPMQYNLKRIVMNTLNRKPLIIWSAGFLATPSDNEMPIRPNLKVASVRGALSKQHIEKIIGTDLDCSVGDAGILASKLLQHKRIEKKYRLGIIPHRKEKDAPLVRDLQLLFPDSVIIDIEPDDPIKGLEEIAQCENVLSSSLHGLIFADSFRIPNKHIIISDKLSGDGFKFDDYYSAYSMKDKPIDLRKGLDFGLTEIRSEYAITDEQVNRLQNDCIVAFHKYLT